MANSTADGSVVIDVDMNVSDAEKELARLKKNIIRIEGEIDEAVFNRERLASERVALKKELSELQKGTKLLSGDKFSDNAESEEKIQKLKSDISKLNAEIQKYDEAIEKSNIKLDFTKVRYGEIASEAERLRKTEENMAQDDSKSDIADLVKSRTSRASLVAQKLNSILAKSGTLISQVVKKAAFLAARMNVFSKLADSLSQKFKRMGSIIKQALVFSVIYKGLSMIREQMGEYLGVNLQFTTALRQLQGALLTAFQPVYEIVVPALTTFINILTQAVATVTQFFASLFGKTAKQAQLNAKGIYEQANATTALGEAAEEAAGSLAGFDEINQIQTENKSGGGGGTSSSDNGPLFDYEYEDTPFDTWGEAFSAFLDKLLGNISKLEDVFDNFADWFNGFSENLYEMFTFPGVQDKVDALGKNLAKAFDRLADKIKWEKFGRALGAGLNTALNFLDGFIYGGDSKTDSQWKRLGKHLAEGINGIVDEVNWYNFGRLLWGGFKIGLETLAGILENLNMPNLAIAASNIIKGFFDEMRNTIDRIDWRKIGENIREFLENVDWNGIAESVFGAIHSAFEASSDFFSGLLGEELKRTLTDLMIALGEALLVVGALLAFSGTNIPLGLLLMAKGALSLAGAAVLDWEYVSKNIKKIATEILIFLGASLLAIGAVLCFSKANLPLGIGLMIAGAASLAAAAGLNWEWLQPKIKGVLAALDIALNAAKLALGVVLLFTGAGIPLGLGLIALGAAGLASSIKENWNYIPQKLKEVFQSVQDWWNSNVAKYFTAEYWRGLGQDLVDWFMGGLNGIFDELSWWAKNVKRTIDSAFGNATRDGVFGSGGNSGGFGGGRMSTRTIPDLPAYNVPALAQGAVIPPNREFMAVLGDQRRGYNIEAPEDLIRKIVREESGGGNESVIMLLQSILEAVRAGRVMVADRDVLARTVRDGLNNITRQSGKFALDF